MVTQSKKPFSEKATSDLNVEKKQIVLVISRCVDDPDKFRLIKKESSLGQNMIMFPASKISKGSGSMNSAFKASNKCAIYGELKQVEKFDWEDEHGLIDVDVCEAIEVAGSGFDPEESMVLLTLDQIINHENTTPVTKEAASHVRARLQS